MFLIFYTTSSFGAEWVLVEEFDLPNIKNSQKIYVDKQTAEVRPNGMILVKSVGIWDKTYKSPNGRGKQKTLSLLNLIDCDRKSYRVISYSAYGSKFTPKSLDDIKDWGPWPRSDWRDKAPNNEKLFSVCENIKVPKFWSLDWKHAEGCCDERTYIAKSSIRSVKEEGIYDDINFYVTSSLGPDAYVSIHFNVDIECKKREAKPNQMRIFWTKTPSSTPADIFSNDFKSRDQISILRDFRKSICGNGFMYESF